MIVVYGTPQTGLVDIPSGATVVSPTIPGSLRIEALADASADRVIVLAPRGSLERRFVLAHALRLLRSGGMLTALGHKTQGGARLKDDLVAFGCAPVEDARKHHRICACGRPAVIAGIDAALAAGSLQRVEAIDAWTQPGVFSWDRIDRGSALLLAHLPILAGQGVDLGCGIGVLARALLASPAVRRLDLVDLDGRAVDAARRNISDPRARFHWADAAGIGRELSGLDFVVMNPPFHDGSTEDPDLGRAFIRIAAALLRPGGSAVLVANRHLPYEAVMKPLFTSVELLAQDGGYKIYRALK